MNINKTLLIKLFRHVDVLLQLLFFGLALWDYAENGNYAGYYFHIAIVQFASACIFMLIYKRKNIQRMRMIYFYGVAGWLSLAGLSITVLIFLFVVLWFLLYLLGWVLAIYYLVITISEYVLFLMKPQGVSTYSDSGMMQ